MNKTLSVSEIPEPPLYMLVLAVISLVFNLCFPQYSAYAREGGQKFVHDDNLESHAIALNDIKKSIETKQNDQIGQEASINSEDKGEVYSQLTLEPQKKAVAKVASAKKNAVKVNSTPTSSSAKSKLVTVTAYSSTVDQCDSNPFVTASGTRVRDGIIATNLLAFGTKVKFPSLFGDKVFTVEDRMSKRFSNRADIWFETKEQAKQFGVRVLEMVIVS